MSFCLRVSGRKRSNYQTLYLPYALTAAVGAHGWCIQKQVSLYAVLPLGFISKHIPLP